jgi:hypothetical protein
VRIWDVAGLDIQKWTPDGDALLVREMFERDDQRVLSIRLAGGEPRPTGTADRDPLRSRDR